MTLGLLDDGVEYAWKRDYLTVPQEFKTISDSLVFAKESASLAEDQDNVIY